MATIQQFQDFVIDCLDRAGDVQNPQAEAARVWAVAKIGPWKRKQAVLAAQCAAMAAHVPRPEWALYSPSDF